MSSKIDMLGNAYRNSLDVLDFNKLIIEYRPEILAIVKSILKNQGCSVSYAEDIESEIEFKLLSAIPAKYNPTANGFTNWANVLVVNYTKDCIRRMKRTIEVDDDIPDVSHEDVDDIDLYDKMRNLTPIQASTVRMIVVDGYTYRETGEKLGVSTGKAWKLYKEALSIIKETLE